MLPHDNGHAEDFRHIRERLDGMEQGAEISGWHRLVSAYQSIGLAVLHHERAEIMRPGHDFLRISQLHRPVAGHVFHPLAEQSEIRGQRRIDQVNELQRHRMIRGERADFLAVAEQDGCDDLFLHQPGGGFDHANVLTFGENHALRMAA